MVTANLHAYALRDQINVYPQAHPLAHTCEREDRGGPQDIPAMTSSLRRLLGRHPHASLEACG